MDVILSIGFMYGQKYTDQVYFRFNSRDQVDLAIPKLEVKTSTFYG
jgi:hypothetical protein